MINMEAYHPINTPNYKLDWFTAPSLKKVHHLRVKMLPNETIQDTIQFVSKTMRLTMSSQKISWIIIASQDKLAGWVTIQRLNNVTASLIFSLLSTNEVPQIKSEIESKLLKITKGLQIKIINTSTCLF